MKIDILTLFPNMFNGVFKESIIKRAREKKLLKVFCLWLTKAWLALMS